MVASSMLPSRKRRDAPVFKHEVKMNVHAGLVAVYGFRGGPGGISHVMQNLMHAMVDEGVSVDLLLDDPWIPEVARLSEKIRVIPFLGSNPFLRVPWLVRYLKTRSPAVLLTNREPANRDAFLARAFGCDATRIVVRVGMTLSKALGRRGFLKRSLRKSAIIACYRRADAIIANSEGVAKDISAVTGILRASIHVIRNPTVSREMFEEAEAPLDHPWFAPGAPPVILGVGRLARQKDFPTLIRAFAMLRSKRPCRLVILGEGKERKNLVSLASYLGIQTDAELAGHVSNPFSFMKRAALFVLSSAWEGSPNVLIQAMALGTPVVAADCWSGPREILQDGCLGPLVPVGDPDALAGAMAQTLDHPPLGQTLREAVVSYRADRCVKDYLQVMGI
jgi:glycosyltransferase involved in cell wall biosynthesis